MLKLLKKVCLNENADIDENILSIIGRAASGSARDGLSILDQAITLSQNDQEIDENAIREMLGLSDHSRIIELFKSISLGDIEKALDEIKEQTDLGAEPSNIISTLGDIVHELTLLKVSKSKDDNLFLGPENFSKLIELKENLDVRKLSRFWQMLLKADSEIKNSFNAYSALEMVIIRMSYVSDLQTPAEIINSLEGSEENKKKKISENNKKNQNQNYEESNISAEPNGESINSFEDIIKLAGKYKFLILKKFLQEDVRLVSFEKGNIDINVPEGQDEIIKELIAKLYEWSNQRWIINVSEKKGDETFIEKEKNIKKQIIDEVSDNDEIKKVMEAFPDSKITAVNKVEN
jgi:DNA polymerase-3 subunit gamma/tau